MYKNVLLPAASSFALLLFSSVISANSCPGSPQQVVGTVYCDNKFTLWVNGEEVATDPIDFTPHQAVKVAFEWDGNSNIDYAIQCEDYASTSGYEYIESRKPQLGDGALIAEFDDALGTVSSADWKVYTATFGPTETSLAAGCSSDDLEQCVVEDRGIPEGWTQSGFNDAQWPHATVYSAAEAGWGRPPSWSANEGCCTLTSPLDRSSLGCNRSVSQQQCLNPKVEFTDSTAQFIWAADLKRDNRVLFRYTARCDAS